jgi:MoaA/NifB/PqqE/SkfB family radical SAM enzyme
MTTQGPSEVIWDMTYACPLRCVHCYSESGRRPARQIEREGMDRIADAIISLRPPAVALAGGEPLVNPHVFDVGERLTRAGILVVLYTSAWSLRPSMVRRARTSFSRVAISVDGVTADLHDRIRGRAGSFDRAMAALALFDAAAGEAREAGHEPLPFGIDSVVMKSNFDSIEDLCTTMAARFPRMSLISFNAAAPAGLASTAGFADHELITDEQADALAGRALRKHLNTLVPPTMKVDTSDNRALRMSPDLIAKGVITNAMQIEPDGEVRALPMYEGSVGNLLSEPASVLWERSVRRWSDPFLAQTLGSVRTMSDWAEASRKIDYHYGSADVRARIDRRPVFVGLPASVGTRPAGHGRRESATASGRRESATASGRRESAAAAP